MVRFGVAAGRFDDAAAFANLDMPEDFDAAVAPPG
jgi:hypothetical protein